MKKLISVLLTLALAAALVCTTLAVPSAAVFEEAEDRYMDHDSGDENEDDADSDDASAPDEADDTEEE